MSYLVDDETLIDCGDWHDEYISVKTVLLTHSHFDHIYGLNVFLQNCPDVKIYTNAEGARMLRDAKGNLSKFHGQIFEINQSESIIEVAEGQTLCLNDTLTAKAIFTPGHNPSCITWLIGDALFTGDSYILGIKTVTNLPGGDKKLALESVARIEEISNTKTIYPGHKLIK